MTTFADPIADREAQRARWEKEARRLDKEARQVCERIDLAGDHDYHDPDEYDLVTWRGEALYCGIAIRLGYAVRVSADLSRGLGPFYCPEHGEEHRAGWRARLCIECAWDATMADDALAWARIRARAWKHSQQEEAA